MISPSNARQPAIHRSDLPCSPSNHCATCPVRDKALCTALTPPEMAKVAQGITRMDASSGQTIFDEGDAAASLYIVRDGVVRLVKLFADGRRQILGFVYPGEAIGHPIRDCHLQTAEAITDVKLCRIPRDLLGRVMSSSISFDLKLLGIAESEVHAAHDQIVLLGRKHAGERLAQFLLNLFDKTSTGPAAKEGQVTQILLPMSREDIADYLGLTIETVSRCFTKLKTKGAIALPSAKAVQILRPDILRAAAIPE